MCFCCCSAFGKLNNFIFSAFVDQRAQKTNKGWNSNRIARAKSVFKPKASRCSVNWLTLPGNINIKKIATAHPNCFEKRGSITSPAPSSNSTKPEPTTTMSGSMGSQGGTWAVNSDLANVRWPIPAKIKPAPSKTLKTARNLTTFARLILT